MGNAHKPLTTTESKTRTKYRKETLKHPAYRRYQIRRVIILVI